MATGLGTKLTSASGLETPPSDSESAVSVCPNDNGDCSAPVPSEENEDPNRHEIFDTLASTILPQHPLIPDEKCVILDVVEKLLTGTSPRLFVMMASDIIRSLCFILASYCYCRQFHLPVPILFISPLVALVQKLGTLFQKQDSLRVLCLYEEAINRQIMEPVINGSVDVLLLTPEMLEKIFHCTSYELPQVSFACIDNAECVVELQVYRHTYLRLNKLLKELGVKYLLGLSALATGSTRTSVIEQFELKEIPGCHSPVIPENIQLCASCCNKDEKLIEVLNQIYPLRIIVVCGTVDKVEDVSEMLQQRLSSFSTHTESADATDTETLKRRKLTVVEQYVYPMSPENKRVSDSFEGNEINVVVTTHTFGMGLPRADVIIYYTMPRTYESLMNGIHQVRRQQQGHVHVLLDEQEKDRVEKFCSSTMNISTYGIEKQVKEIFKGRFARVEGISKDCLAFILGFLESAGHLELAQPISDCHSLKKGYNSPKRHQLKQICETLHERLVKQAISRAEAYEQLYNDLSSSDNGLEDRIARKFSSHEWSASTTGDDSHYSTMTATTQESIASTSPLQQQPLQDSTAAGSQTDGCSQVTTSDMLGDADHFDITTRLTSLDKIAIYNLGQALGLSYIKVKEMKDSDTFLDDVIAAWLRREDHVEQRGMPTWKVLVEALKHTRVKQNGIASDISRDMGL